MRDNFQKCISHMCYIVLHFYILALYRNKHLITSRSCNV